jgi:methyl-accepting chemotaxis protein
MSNRKIKKRTFSLWIKIAILPLLGLLALFFIKGMDLYLNAKTGRASAMGQYASNIAWMMTERVLTETEFLNSADEKLVEQIQQESVEIDRTLAEAKALDNDKEMQKLLEDVEKAADGHHKAFENAAKMVRTLTESKTRFMSQLNTTDEIIKKPISDLIDEKAVLIMMEGRDLPDTKKALREGLRELNGYISSIILNLNDLLAGSDAKRFEETVKKLSDQIQNSFTNTAGMVSAVNEEKYTDYFKKIKAEYDITLKKQDTLFTQWKQLQVFAAALEKTNTALTKSLQEVVTGTKQKIAQIESFGFWLSVIAIGITTVFLVLLSIVVIRSITKPINRTVNDLNESADQVAAASNQVSSASQQLAEGSAQQAASLEETSSSLEEMGAMTKQNAENANMSDTLMKEANQVVSRANGSMTQLSTSMEDISKASEETSKIIKTIDEIAFQTNLLALNAAVEAARAGEAGAGFAVVADEVRNLALRAADAAKNTAVLIEGTVKKVKDGLELVTKTDEDFSEVAASTAKLAELIGEIAAASNEQARGIVQVNTAVQNMDSLTQQNAANAEESASASEEMNAQAEQMKGFVQELVWVVNGSANGKAGSSMFKGDRNKHRALKHASIAALVEKPSSKNVVVAESKEVRPEQVIPMDEDDDFNDF